MLDKAPNQPSKFRTKNWVERNNNVRGTYNTSMYKTSMLKLSLCVYSDAYIFVSRTITITGAGDNDAAKEAYERDKGVIFKNCEPFTDCTNKTNNT